MAGGDPHPPRPPQEDVEHLTTTFFELPSAEVPSTFSTLIGKHLLQINLPITSDKDGSHPNLVIGSPHLQDSIFPPNHIFKLKTVALSHPQQSYADILLGLPTKNVEDSLFNSVSPKESPIDGGCNGFVQLKPTSTYNGKPAVTFSISDKLSLIKRMKHVLVAKFSHGRPSLATVKEFFASFHLKDLCNISVYDSKHLILECQAFEDYVKIWMSKQWMVGGFLMRVFKWREDFHPSLEAPVCPVWVHLPGLPLYLYEEEVLMSIANTIGRPLALDLDNINRSKLGCASFCVEVDVSAEIIDKIWIDFEVIDSSIGRQGIWQNVVFDPFPPYCNGCAHLGHTSDHCLRLKNMGEGMQGLLKLAPQSADLCLGGSNDGMQGGQILVATQDSSRGPGPVSQGASKSAEGKLSTGEVVLVREELPIEESTLEEGEIDEEDVSEAPIKPVVSAPNSLQEGGQKTQQNLVQNPCEQTTFSAAEVIQNCRDGIAELGGLDGAGAAGTVSIADADGAIGAAGDKWTDMDSGDEGRTEMQVLLELVSTAEHSDAAARRTEVLSTPEQEQAAAERVATKTQVGTHSWAVLVEEEETAGELAASSAAGSDLVLEGQQQVHCRQLEDHSLLFPLGPLVQQVTPIQHSSDLLTAAAGIRCTNSSSNIKQQDQVGRASDGLRGGQVNSNDTSKIDQQGHISSQQFEMKKKDVYKGINQIEGMLAHSTSFGTVPHCVNTHNETAPTMVEDSIQAARVATNIHIGAGSWAALMERMHRLRGDEPEKNVVRPIEVVKGLQVRKLIGKAGKMGHYSAAKRTLTPVRAATKSGNPYAHSTTEAEQGKKAIVYTISNFGADAIGALPRVGETSSAAKHDANEEDEIAALDPAPSKLLSAAALEFSPAFKVIGTANHSLEAAGNKAGDQLQPLRPYKSILSDEMCDFILPFKCKSVPTSPSPSRKRSDCSLDLHVFSPASMDVSAGKYGCDTSSYFESKWSDLE